MKLTNGRVFLISMVVTATCVLLYHKATYVPRTRPSAGKDIRILDFQNVYLTDQLHEGDFGDIAKRDIATIVDMRPDDEAPDQMPSKRVAELSQKHDIDFEYIPIPHGDIPAAGVNKLMSVLNNGKRPILLYCRTGKRALRTFCLAEASRKGGHDAIDLARIAGTTDFDIKDLKPEIEKRIAARGSK